MASDGTKGKAPIPKFSSFKLPTPQPSAPGKDTQREAKEKPSRSAGRLERVDASKSHERHSKEKSRDRRIQTPSDKDPRYNQLDEQRHDSLPNDEGLFVFDGKGDKNNVTFGSLHKYNIPRYYRSGANRVLGLPSTYTINQELGTRTTIVIQSSGTHNGSSKHKRRDLWKGITKFPRRQHPARTQTLMGSSLEQDYIPLDSHGSNKRRRIDDVLPSGEIMPPEFNELPDYRSVEGKAKPDQPDLEFDGDSDTDLEFNSEGARLRNVSLFRQVEDNPNDIQAWLQLIDHQGYLVGVVDSEGSHKYTTSEKRSIADMKISLYEKALRTIPHQALHTRLILGMMEEGAVLWDRTKLADTWKSMLESHPGHISLWIKYLDFQQTDFAKFSYEKCRSVFLACLEINRRHINDTERNVINIYLLLRLSLFMRETGFSEHAIGLWQALLEYNFCRPEKFTSKPDVEAMRAEFLQFWDSETPRIGEEDSKGWNQEDGNQPSPKTDTDVPSAEGVDIFESWVTREQGLANLSVLPARTLDDVREDDPYRVILSFDIADFLVDLSDPAVAKLLVNAFLIFCRLPPQTALEQHKSISHWRTDPYFCNHILDDTGNIVTKWFVSEDPDCDSSSQQVPFRFPHCSIACNLDALFGDGTTWFSMFDLWKSTYMNDSNLAYTDWVRRALKALVSRFPEDDMLAEYVVAFEYTLSPVGAKKFAKSLLKVRSSSIRLYNAYAVIETRNGQLATAEKVWATALTMSQNFPETTNLEHVLLWRTWAWESLNSKQYSKALRLILAIPQKNVDLGGFSSETGLTAKVLPADFLKSQRYLSDIQAHGLSFGNARIFSDSTDCLAILLYLTRDYDITSAMDVYREAERRLQGQKLETFGVLESIHQTKARLLLHHMKQHRVYKVAQIREEISQSISLFPQNTILLDVLGFTESRSRIDDRVRVVLRQQMNQFGREKQITDPVQSITQPFLIPYLFAIYSELHRGVSAGSTVHSARAAFENAASSESRQFCAGLWKLYILFELRLGERQKARHVFFRSIRACPWSKQLILLAYHEPGLREEMGFDRLKKLWDVFGERELRTHIDLEELIDEDQDSSS
ncbi:hypothetical protein FQN57_006647 [Myotisia sp. PD_48]|nr:hypothetical protein FQN57_006647 [Myotisia sp. PD_48]